jgi:hypothetical protein
MKNLSDFNSFVQTINEAAPWNPMAAKKAIDDLMKNNKDAEPTGLSFANIQKVYGKNDYMTRFKIAQALLLIGKNIFPASDSTNFPAGFFFTTYSGKKEENLKMDKISDALLKSVKPIVDDFETDRDTYFDLKKASAKPAVRQAKVAADKISS